MKTALMAILLFPCLVFGQTTFPNNIIPLVSYNAETQNRTTSTVTRSVMQASKSGFDLQGVTVAEVIQLIYSNALGTPYVLSPEVLLDTRPVSFRWSSSFGSLQVFLLRFLDSLGYKLEKVGNVDFVGKYTGEERYQEFYIYRPKFRSVKYLADLIAPMLGGSFNTSNQVGTEAIISQNDTGLATNTNALGRIGRDSDTLVYSGPPEDIDKLKTLLSSLDLPSGEVLVRGLVYEVGFNEKEGSAFSLITSLFDNSLKIGVNADAMIPGANFLSFKNITIDFIANILSSDSRFTVVSSPSLRILSGEHGRFNVGQEVPVIGSISYPENSSPVQSIEYRSSGVIFSVLPQVFESRINLKIEQQISNFVRTETGVNDSPTLTKREISTSVSMNENEIIVLGGLAETKDSEGRSGFSFLPRFLHANTSERSRSEIILVLQVTRIDGV